MRLRKFLQEKIPKEFNVIWSQMLTYKAQTGVFSTPEIWEDATIIDSLSWWKTYG